MQSYKNYFITPIKKHYFDFEGRASRKNFWMYELYFCISYFVLVFLGFLVLPRAIITLVLAVFWLGLIIPSIAFSTRRLHDAGYSGWWQLLLLVPFVGAIVVIVLLCLSTNQRSRY